MKSKTLYSLPNGEVTDDSTIFLDAWVSLGRWIKNIEGFERIHSFDPTYTFLFNGRTVQIEPDFLIALNEYVDELVDVGSKK